jgi:hypothetical protein
MQGLQQLSDFYEIIADDARIGVSHICLYVALLYEWNLLAWRNPISVHRHSLMRHARMSRKTYNKCMKELQEYGYIKYTPSCHPFEGSQVYFKRLL